MSSISLCIIAKNEESMIGKCFESVKTLVSEIILVDTGSTDKTIEIGLQYGAKVVKFPWIDDFSAARNEGMKYATSDWILMLDADEVIPPEALEAYKEAVRGPKNIAYNVFIRNISDTEDDVLHYNFRLFPRHPSVKFVNKIHEALVFDSAVIHKGALKGLEIVHYGYMAEQKARKGTNDRNLRILLKVLDEEPEKSHMHYYTAQQYMLLNDLDNAEKHYLTALNELAVKVDDKGKAVVEKEIFTPLIYNGLSRVAQLRKDTPKVLELLKHETIAPDFYTGIGHYLIDNQDPVHAAEAYDKALELRYNPVVSCAYDAGSMTWKPCVGLGNAYLGMGKVVKAMDCFKLALEYKPNYAPLLKTLSTNFKKLNQMEEAETYLARLCKIEDTAENWIELANIYANTNRLKESLPIFFKYGTPELLLTFHSQLFAQKQMAMANEIVKHLTDSKILIQAPIRTHKKGPCLTVIIPTLAKAPKEWLDYTVNQLSSNDLVKNIIIIDNTEDKSVATYPSAPNVQVVKDQPNLYVNAAWNYGMSLCDTEYYLLLNDDILCHKTVLDDCYNVLENDPQIHLLQIATNNIPMDPYVASYKNAPTTSAQYFIQKNQTMMGWFLFGRKADWLDIPKDLKYFFGDNIIYINMQLKQYKIAQVVSKHIAHATSTTVNATNLYKQGLLNSEQVIFQSVLPQVFPGLKVIVAPEEK